MTNRPSYYITTAIDYVNGRPHLGHAYEKVLTDVLARYQRRQGADVFFLTGVDEHGMKVQQSAAKQGRQPQEFCDEMAGHFRALYDRLNISYDDFVRTTQPRHKEVVQKILQQLFDAGEIYSADYEGYYSTRLEQFLTEKDRVDGKFPESFGEVVFLQEKNYFFKLSQYQGWLLEFYQNHPDFIYPSFRTKEVLGALQEPIPDLCISRPAARLSWGIPLPFDSEQVTYVWFDALVNYLSVLGYERGQAGGRWPAVHVIGKDILVPPHAIYWPAMLKAIGVAQPRQLVVHGWWTQNKEKMSKSVGNVVDPLELIDLYGVDAFRYFVMREMALGYDADFSEEQFKLRYQSELGNTLGNLVNRSVSMIHRYRGGVVPSPMEPGTEAGEGFRRDVLESIRVYRENMDKLQLHVGIMELWKGLMRVNQFVDETAPFKMAKDEARRAELDHVLHELAAALELFAQELQVLLPGTALKMCEQLGGGLQSSISQELHWPESVAGRHLGQAQVLFPRLEETPSPKPA
ncbi:MAG: methionine--tRNA ligase [Blastochloris sp.]|nr:methionine--tRNA ligase [Blastochloris sp.]